MHVVDPAAIASKYLEASRSAVEELGASPMVAGFIATSDPPSIAYANATRQQFSNAGFGYDLRQVKRLELEDAILEANEDPTIHGIFIYFPVFSNQQDDYLRNLVDFKKDIEAGSLYWTRKLYANDRLAIKGDTTRKALLPCTPLAIVKILDEIDEYGSEARPLREKRVTIFNRSEVIGRPLAVMMSNDGATVYSFDEFGPLEFRHAEPFESEITREEALEKSDIIITGVPSEDFRKVNRNEISSDSVCVNFSSVKNFEDDIADYVKTFVPRVGPMTVAMCMRNTIRLFKNFHQES
ncbi:MAG: bifunctional methylenetetrahydrofolate dehydrogenase/methenyltetrahydrofolate cyclohydrolase [Proteobacteria bacterium]|nr:bifunctional methylenetetrahydrofolate dehydrogenase/methenyltetrahydrofolate cyclohydrolase [Pseudomonadota bacterium]